MKAMKHIVIGAGPTGIGAALSLKEDCFVIEQGAVFGGFSQSIEIEGAVFDFGGHSFHTPHEEVRDLVFNSLDMEEQKRDARCYAYGDLISYPFQKSFRELGNQQVVDECAAGLEALNTDSQPQNFEEFIQTRFGKGISEHFMLPYNRKLWGRDLKRLSADWTSERVAAPEGVKEKFDTQGGKRKPLQKNTSVAYPSKGGFGEIFTALGKQIKNVSFNTSVTHIDPKRKIAYTGNGQEYGYETLVSTIPVTQLLDMIEGCPDSLKQMAGELDFLSLKLGLVVVDHMLDTDIQRIYCADETVAAHKTALNHTSSQRLRTLPRHGIIAEISTGPDKVPYRTDYKEWIAENLLTLGLVKDTSEIKRIDVLDKQFAYPVPSFKRNDIIDQIKVWLESHDIFTSGRFGEWAYINSDEALYRGMLMGRKLAGSY